MRMDNANGLSSRPNRTSPSSTSKPDNTSGLGYFLPPTDAISNSSAPNAWPWYIDRIVVLLIYAILGLVIFIPVTIWSSVTFYLRGPTHPDWDYKTQVISNIMYYFIAMLFMFKLPGVDYAEGKIKSALIRPGLKVEGITIPPCQPEFITGWAKHKAVQPIDRPGFMIWPKKDADPGSGRKTGLEMAGENEKVILYFVGGGFISGHPLLSHLAWTVSDLLNARVFCANYRKSLNSSSAFPGSLLDALSAYLYLVQKLHFKPSNIVLMGDSAGGNSSLGLARYLGELKREKIGGEVGMVGGMILFSPWCDMTEAPGTSIETNKKYDYVSSLGGNGISAHTRHYPTSLRSPYFSPALPAPDGSPRFTHLAEVGAKIYIQTGTAELLFDQDHALAKGMKEEGVDVMIRSVPGDIHVGILFSLKKPLDATKKDLPELWARI